MPTPREYEDRYHQLDVILDDFETTTVDVHRYRNNDEKYKTEKYAETNTVEAWKQKDRLVGQMTAEIRKLRKTQLTKPKLEWKPRKQDVSLELDTSFLGSPGIFTDVLTQHMISPGTYSEVVRQARLFPGLLGSLAMAEVLERLKPAMVAVHTGKGSPEAIAVALHLVAKYKLYDKKFKNPALGVQDYCERYIGLDCNGFVANYAQAIGISSKTLATFIGNYAPQGARRADLNKVQPNDVLVFTDFSHITIIDSVAGVTTGPDGKQALTCRVVEATASNLTGEAKNAHGALQNSVYSLGQGEPSRKGEPSTVFHAERPRGSKHISHFYIAPLA
jgi:hypothetical protein